MQMSDLVPMFTWTSIVFACIIIVVMVFKVIENKKTINSYVKYKEKIYNDKRKKHMNDVDPFDDIKDPWNKLDKKVGNR